MGFGFADWVAVSAQVVLWCGFEWGNECSAESLVDDSWSGLLS